MKRLQPNGLISLLFLVAMACQSGNTADQSTPSKGIEPPTTTRLPFSSGVRAIFQDSRGHYWFGSHQDGVCRLASDTFTCFTTLDGLADNQVRSIQEATDGHIWLGTGHGVSSFDGHTMRTHSLPLQNNTISHWQLAANDLWFNAEPMTGVYRYDGQALSHLTFPKPYNSQVTFNYQLTCQAKGRHNRQWFGTYQGIFGYDGDSFTYINNETTARQQTNSNLHVRSIMEDASGRLWIGNNGIGVLLYSNDTLVNFSKEQGLLHPLSRKSGATSPAGTLEHVFAIAQDAEGNIWFGDRDTGAWRYDGQTMTNYIVDSHLSSPMIWHIFKDQSDRLLFGMAAGGVYQFNGQSFDQIY